MLLVVHMRAQSFMCYQTIKVVFKKTRCTCVC